MEPVRGPGNWHSNQRMLGLFTPFFPLTGSMAVVFWQEAIPPQV